MISIRLRCAICGHAVHGVMFERDDRERTTTLAAFCHGATDRMVVHDNDKARWSSEEIEQWDAIQRGDVEGVAFITPAIEGSG